MSTAALAVEDDAAPALEALTDYSNLETIERLCAELAEGFAHAGRTDLASPFGLVAHMAYEAQFQRLAILDDLGLEPGPMADEAIVEINGRTFTLPRSSELLTRELVRAAVTTAAGEETSMESIVSNRPAAKVTAISERTESGFVGRYVTPVVSRLRFPTFKEGAIAIGLGLVALAIYAAVTDDVA